MAYKLREKILNPLGGEYAKLTDAAKDDAADIAIAAMRDTVDRIVVPQLIAMCEGDTRKVTASLAGILATSLINFMDKNRAEDQKQNGEVYSEACDCLEAQIEALHKITLLRAVGLDPNNLPGNVKVMFI